MSVLGGEVSFSQLNIGRYGESWKFDDIEDFFAEYRDSYSTFGTASIWAYANEYPVGDRLYPEQLGYLTLRALNRDTIVTINAKTRTTINRMLAPWRDKEESGRLLPIETKEAPAPPPVRIFIGHGRNPQWRDLKDHLADHHGYQVEAYESGARAGHVIRDVLGELLKSSSFAILVMTGEDETSEGGMRARQNVVHEVGLFQGRIGFSRAIVLVERGIEVFSNLQGVNQIKFSKDNIRESYGEVLATLRREFGDRR
ncbi:TIR domain-containing protein [Micromonospora wenchangensis]|uniref:TIR domain-containing protein n=1 Tax=Micromonospora wenchangensis TaxID=1185415 RepID=UPI003D75466C